MNINYKKLKEAKKITETQGGVHGAQMRNIGLVAFIVALAITGYGCKKRKSGADLYNKYKIAFVSDRDGNTEIYVMNADGTEQKNLTNNPAADIDPKWSPDGKKIAFLSLKSKTASIYLMNVDGSERKRLANMGSGSHFYVWSPVPTMTTKEK